MNHNFAAYYRGCGGPSILSMHGNENVYSSLSSLHELGKPKRKAKNSYQPKVLKVPNWELSSLSMKKNTIQYGIVQIASNTRYIFYYMYTQIV